MSFSKIFQIHFIVDSTFIFFFIPVPQQFMVVFLVVILRFWRPKKIFSQSCSILFKIRDSSLLPSSRNCFDHENSFHLSGAIQESSQFDYLQPIKFRFIHSQLSVIILLSCRCINQISSNQFLISSFSCI